MFSCMEDTIIMTEVTTAAATMRKRGHRERRRARLRPVEPRDCQFRDLHAVRLYLLQAADAERLGLLQRFQRISGRAVRRDVRLSAHHLLPLGMVAVAISRRRLVLARCWPSPGDGVRMEGQSARGPVPYPERRVHRRGIRADFGRLEGALRRPADPQCRDGWTLQLRPAPA